MPIDSVVGRSETKVSRLAGVFPHGGSERVRGHRVPHLSAIVEISFRCGVLYLYGARYNIRGYFGTLYTSLSKETARREMAWYFTVPPRDGFVEASIILRLRRLVDLTNRRPLRKAGITWEEL